MKLKLTTLLIIWLAGATVALCQQNRATPAPPPVAPSPSATELEELRAKVQRVEDKVNDRSELFQQLDKFFWLISGLAGVGGVLAFLTLFRDSLSKRERTLAANDMKFSNAMATHTERSATAQIENIENVSALIKFVKQAFDLQSLQQSALDNMRKEQEGNLQSAQTTFSKLELTLKAATEREQVRKRDADLKYAHVVERMRTLESVQALEWPTLPMNFLRMADHARIELENIPHDLLTELIAAHPNEHASMLQRMGVAAYYDSYEISIALDLLGEAERLFEKAPTAMFNKVRAYTQHFLAIIEKNWYLTGDSIFSNLDKAAERLRKAVAMLGDDPDHFLTPVTLAEVLSYRGETAWPEAGNYLEAVFEKAQRKGLNRLDKNQTALYTRALLLRGNIEFCRAAAQDPSEPAPLAREQYEKAAANRARNPYALLSQARATEPCSISEASTTAGEAAELWENGLKALNQSDALRKQETTQRVTAIAWAIVAANRLDKHGDEVRYRDEFARSGANKTIAGRSPLYFSPFKMTVVSFDDLARDLDGLQAPTR